MNPFPKVNKRGGLLLAGHPSSRHRRAVSRCCLGGRERRTRSKGRMSRVLAVGEQDKHLSKYWENLSVARACIAAIPALRIQRANLVAELVTCGVSGGEIAQALGVNKQRVSQLVASATEMVVGSVDVMWDRLAVVHAKLEDGQLCYDRQREAIRALVDAGVPRQEIAERAGVTVGSLAYVLGEVVRGSKKAAS